MLEISRLIRVLIDLGRQLYSKIKFMKRQKQRDQLEDNPSEFFNDHFGGMPDNDSSETNKTKTKSRTH